MIVLPTVQLVAKGGGGDGKVSDVAKRAEGAVGCFFNMAIF